MAATLRILYLGDIMGEPGRRVVFHNLAMLKKRHKPHIVMAQAENVSHGKSLTPAHYEQLREMGIDVFTGGNHTIERPTVVALLDDPAVPVLAPMNQPGVQPAWGVKVAASSLGDVQIINVLGTTFPNLSEPIGNPLQAVDQVLEETKHDKFAARIVNFHGDFSSEKRVIGYYLDGRVSAVIGDHWHVPTADAMVLPGGTAHITDVGMCGTLLSSLGVSKEIIISRWRDGIKIKNDIATGGPYQLNAVLVSVDVTSGRATQIKPINQIIEKLG